MVVVTVLQYAGKVQWVLVTTRNVVAVVNMLIVTV